MDDVKCNVCGTLYWEPKQARECEARHALEAQTPEPTDTPTPPAQEEFRLTWDSNSDGSHTSYILAESREQAVEILKQTRDVWIIHGV